MNVEKIKSKLGTFKKATIIKPNMVELEFKNGEALQSYNSMVAVSFYDSLKVYLLPDYDYSNTTSKHLNNWLNETSKERKQNIKDGLYIVVEA